MTPPLPGIGDGINWPIIIFEPEEDGYKMMSENIRCPDTFNSVATEIYHTIVKVREFFLEHFDRWGLDGKGSMIPVIIQWDESQVHWSCQAGACFLRFRNIYSVTPAVLAREYIGRIVDEVSPPYEGQCSRGYMKTHLRL